MNRFIAKSLFTNIKRAYPIHAFKRCHSTFLVADLGNNENGRLRLEEEIYCDQLSTPLQEKYGNALKNVFDETVEKLPNAHMMVSGVQAKTLHQLVRLLRPKQILEIGGFTGYSAIAMGSAMSSNAKLMSLELDPFHVGLARKHVKLADLQDKVQFKEGPAGDSLVELAGNKYDFIFLDADKGGYIDYFELIMKHDMLSDHGVIVADNVLFFGQVHKQAADYKELNEHIPTVEESKNLKKTAAKVHAFNQHVFKDPRVEVVVLPVFDGLSLIRKKL